jgi:hypothetical protein
VVSGVLVFGALAFLPDRGFWAYVAGPPFRLDTASAATILYHDVVPLSLAALFACACWGLGRRLLRSLAPGVDGLLSHCWAFGLGLGVCAQSVFLLGVCGGLNAPCLLAGSALLAAAAARELGPALPRLAARFSRPFAGGTVWSGALAGFLASVAWHALICALAPPTDWDSLAYHLALPKIYWKSGRILEIPWLMHSHWPHLMEALYSVPVALRLDTAAALIHAGVCAALTLAIFAAGRRELGRAAGALAAALFASQPVVLRLAGTPHSDGALAFFHFLSAAAIWEWRRGGGARRMGLLALAGLLAGFASAAKLHGIGLTLIWAAWIAYDSPRSSRRRDVALFLACALAVVFPWYLKTWIGAGNPIWPFFPRLLGGRWGPDVVLASSRRFNWLDWGALPGALRDAGAPSLLAPFAILIALAALQGEILPPFAAFMLLPVLPYFLAVSRRTEVWRFMLPCFPAFALASAWGASCLWAAAGRLGGLRRTALRLAAAVAVAIGLLPRARADENNQLFAVLGARPASDPDADPRELYLERSVDHVAFYRSVDRRLAGTKARILLYREIRGYYLDSDYLWGDPGNQGLIRYASIPDPDGLRRRLAELGVTHVLVNAGLGIYQPGRGDYDPHVVALMDGVLSSGARRVLADGPFALYELLPPTAPRKGSP